MSRLVRRQNLHDHLRQVKATLVGSCNVNAMEQDEPISFVASGAVRCIGSLGVAHEPIEIVLPELTIAACPRCGRRFRRGDPPGAVSPAAWPKDD